MRYVLGSNSEIFCPACWCDLWEAKIVDNGVRLVCHNCDHVIDFISPKYVEVINTGEVVRKIKTRKD